MQKKSEEEQQRLTSGEWELRRRGLQTTKNFNMLLNRINVLTHERDSRLKGIESKLNQHQEFLAKKVERGNYKQEVRQKLEEIRLLNQSRTKSTDLSLSKFASQQSQQGRLRDTVRTLREITPHQQGMEQQQSYKQLRKQQQESNSHKRNMVRLKELESREKVERFWSDKLHQLKQSKEQAMRRTLDTLNDSLGKISLLEQNEAKLLKELERTDALRCELDGILKEEKQLDSSKLAGRYPLLGEYSGMESSRVSKNSSRSHKFKLMEMQQGGSD